MSNNFRYFEKRRGCQNLILFVHGFTGGNSTWENKNGSTFPEALQKDKYIADSFDIATYEYFTTLFDLFAKSKEKYRFIKDIFMGRTHKKEKNLDIQNLSNNLSTHLRFSLAQYEKIYVIAHSMGGLIVKSLIINELKKKGHTKIRLFASLAVPHLGANVATLLKLISTNIQIDNLNPTCEFIGQLNQSWVDLTLKPTTKYFYGSCDEYVTKTSAIAIDNVDKDIISVEEDHSTIAKPENEYSVIVLAIVEIIKEIHEQISLGDIGYQKLESDVQYVDELFVIKLIVADIPADTVKNVKELFFNAEYARKSLKSKHNIKRLEVLFDNIRQLYRDSYDKYLSGEPKNSGLLLAEVHEKISMEDSNLLKSMMEELKVYHKKGMLHQLANDHDSGIWWTKEKEILLKNLGD